MGPYTPTSASKRGPRPDAPRGQRRRWQAPLIATGLFLLVSVVFLPCVNNSFLDYDDARYVTENVNVQRGLNWDSMRWAFASLEAANWHPLTWLSHILDCQLFGLKPWGHHLTSVLLHGANTVLLFLVLRRLTGCSWRSALVAALFGLHPLHVESVAWLAERKDVLSTAFWLMTTWAYARYALEFKVPGSKFKVFYALSLALFALGLMAKPMLVTLPCTLLLLDYWPLHRWTPATAWRLILEKIPFFALTAGSSLVTFAAQKHGGAVAALSAFSIFQRIENALVGYARYLGKLFWPLDLSVFYPPQTHWQPMRVALSALLLAGVSTLVFLERRKSPWLVTGWCWFLVTLAPVSGIVQVGEQSMADRFTYVPFIGLFVALVWSLPSILVGTPQPSTRASLMLFRLCGVRSAQRAAPTFAVAVIVLLICGLLTSRQIRFWKDTDTLFRHALAVDPNNYLACFQLGSDALRRPGGEQEAMARLNEAIRLRPDYAPAFNNLALALEKSGREEEAIPQLHEAIRLDPSFCDARVNLGVALEKMGREAEAMSQFNEAIRLDPSNCEARVNMAMALEGQGRLDEAIGQWRQALRLNPLRSDIYVHYGIALEGKGELQNGLLQFDQALKLRPDDPEAHLCRGKALVLLKRFDEAVNEFQTVASLRPDSSEAQKNLAMALRLKAAAANPARVP